VERRYRSSLTRTCCAPILFVIGALLALGCETSSKTPSELSPGDSSSPPDTDEQSPNARILPEPLAESEPQQGEKESEGELSAAAAPKVRPQARPWPLRAALPEDPISPIPASGYSLAARFVWEDVARAVPTSKTSQSLWPTLELKLLREVADQTARLRWVHTSKSFALPKKTELRLRADRLGALVLWADQRSYRLAPEGSLRSLFSDRRVDRLPFVEAEVKQLGPEKALDREAKKIRVVTSVGTTDLLTTELRDLPYASQLLCRVLFELVRVKSNDEMCPKAHLPLSFSVDWEEGGSLAFEVLSFSAEVGMDRESFRTPPALPIHKKGELPPMDAHPLSKKLRKKTLSLGIASEVLLPPLAPAPSPPADGTAVIPTPAVKRRPKNELLVENATDRRLLVLLDQVPYRWLEPGESKTVFASTESIRVGARDFLGEKLFDEGIIGTPRDVVFGGKKVEERADPGP